MILDNENKNLKVHQWIEYNTNIGEFDVVTGYFTIGALAFLSEKTNEKIDKYRFVIGDIVHNHDQKTKSIDLLNENLSTEDAFKLSKWAKDTTAFLKQNKVICKTLEPNFCHAKLFLTKSKINNPVQEVYIMGSSNLTEAGIGLKSNQNIELNSAGTGTESIYAELKLWFEDLWNKPQAHLTKTIKDINNKDKKVDFKQYLIDEISKIFKVYDPIDIYHKIIYELFNEEQDIDFQKDLSKLETTEIYKKLYPFQKNGVENLLKILDKYNGAILADAVGLGKTWTTLAIIKYYQSKGRDTLLICPKKLEENWNQYSFRSNSIFTNDNFNFMLKFHTDFTDKNIKKDKLNIAYLTNDKPKLIVIDESHNLRNDKSIKYKILMDHILKQVKGDIKVLLLSATPINNNFKDIRNQFALLTKGDNTGFKEMLDVRNLSKTFNDVQANFNKWNKEKSNNNLNQFYQDIHQSDFFKLTENLVIARTRKIIKNHFDKDFHFPTIAKPINIFKTPLQFGDFDNLPDLMEKLNLNLSAYQPSQFTLTLAELESKEIEKQKKRIKDAVLTDNVQREFFLVKMMKILMLKRLESSWLAFKITIDNIYDHHDSALKKIKAYQEAKKDVNLDPEFKTDLETDEDLSNKLEEYELGKKNPIKLSEIDAVGRLDDFKNAIIKDKQNLLIIKTNISDFEKSFEKNPKNDIKIHELHNIIKLKQKNDNKKIVIFTAYKDTAEYLYKQIKNTHPKISLGLVFSDTALINNNLSGEKNITISKLLQHFAPYTKLFLEKKWDKFALEKTKENYPEWQKWISENEFSINEIINNQIDILITTDVLSEGQNLQDADMVINYDIHWNPVRVIQRFGRIDRIGSPNQTITCINFWPSSDIEEYINLKSRVEKRMAVMQFIGSEVIQNFTEEFAEMSENPIEDKQNEALLIQLKTKLEDFEDDQSIGFNDFSFDIFRQQLFDVLNQNRKELENLPNGIFSGFEIEKKHNQKAGIIAFMGVLPKKNGKYNDFELIYLSENGELISNNQKVILEILSENRNNTRKVASEIDNGNNIALEKWQKMILNWISKQNAVKNIDETGNETLVAGQNQLSVLSSLQKGNSNAIAELKNNEIIFIKKFDLITWLIIS